MTPPVQDLVTISIDGKAVEVPKGTLVIRAAEQVGVHIPRFCDHPLLKPVAACRACLVDVATPGRDGTIQKMPKPQPACSTTVTPGMEVETQYTSEVAKKAQEGVLEFLLVNHPLDCPVCDKGGECPLQNQAMSDGRADSRFTGAKRLQAKPVRLTSEILLDRERCILCQRCVRFGKEIPGDAFLDLQGRGGGASPLDAHGFLGEQIGNFDTQILGFVDEADNPDGHTTTRTESLTGPCGEAGLIGSAHAGPVSLEDRDLSGRAFSSYFSGNVIQICPVGALTSATYRFRSRPFDLVSTPSVTDHDASGAAIRVDARRGQVLRHLAGEDAEVNEEWLSDKDRFAFTWQASPDRLTSPMIRAEDGTLVATSWPTALRAAAEGLAKAKAANGVAFLPGGRLTFEDAYAWSKFARVVAGSNAIDFRARTCTQEEADLLRADVAGSGLGVTYADVEKAPQVLAVGFEAEDECATLYLRLRKAVDAGTTKVCVLSPFTTPGSKKLKATVLKAQPGTEAEVIAAITKDAEGGLGNLATSLGQDGSIILLGERAADTPGLITQVRALAQRTGARLAWIPRRAGERGALEAGCFPNLLPFGRTTEDAEARADVAAVWGVDSLPDAPFRCQERIIEYLNEDKLSALVIGGVDLRDMPEQDATRAALANADFVVQLEVRHSAITPDADVVFPVAPPHEKAGTFINWEGRLRPFGQALTSKELSDHAVLDRLAKASGVDLGTYTLKEIHTELAQLKDWDGARAPFRDKPMNQTPVLQPGQAVLGMWKPLLDAGRCQDGEPHLAGTSRVPVARVSAATAKANNLQSGVALSTDKGVITLPLVVTDMPDETVWVPQCSAGSTVYATLGAAYGAVVSLNPAEVTQ
ncbi:MAG: NADH-quinone oxidoreductase subunit G [Actinomycetaceae bacterium]|nr:NADH-quinone oxidoreductase subunit G [Actinomycetaceae bacterium]